MKNVFVVRADYGLYTEAFKQNGYVGIGWFDREVSPNITKDEIKELYQVIYPSDAFMRMNQNAGQIYRFIHDIKFGDIVMTPFQNGEFLVGEVTSDLYFKHDHTSNYDLRKNVNWYNETLDRTSLSISLQNSLRSSLTCFSVQNSREILEYYNIVPPQEQAEIRTTIDLYQIIKDKLLELDNFEFEDFVSYLLQSIGFTKTNATQGRTNDGGIDFEGVLEIFGVASVNLQVQVKRYETNPIKWQTIDQFRGAMKRDFQGCFITLSNFQDKAKRNASDPKRIPINLIDGKKLIDIFIEKYEDIIEIIRQEDNDTLADKLKFRKALLP